jgi:hypothetical protein
MEKIDFDKFERTNATDIGFVSLVGVYSSEWPIKWGNYFSMSAEDGKSYQIVNFWYENLEQLLEHKEIEFPIPLLILDDGYAMIHDPRIPDDWYVKDSVSTCVPRRYHTIHQQAKHQRGIDGGWIEEFDTVQKFDMGKQPKIDTKYWETDYPHQYAKSHYMEYLLSQVEGEIEVNGHPSADTMEQIKTITDGMHPQYHIVGREVKGIPDKYPVWWDENGSHLVEVLEHREYKGKFGEKYSHILKLKASHISKGYIELPVNLKE